VVDFIALDIELANPSLDSICQIGLAAFTGDQIELWASYINPEDYFSPLNEAVHGITAEIVRFAPTLPGVIDHLQQTLTQQVVVTHTPFDKLAINRSLERYNLSAIDCTWLDSARVVRRAWTEYAASGYALAKITQVLGIQFAHHQAQEDARAAGLVLLEAMKKTGLSLEEWLVRVNQPIAPGQRAKISRRGNPDGPLAGEVAVFTGALSIPRKQASDLAAEAGCDVRTSVSKKTTLLVVGDQDIRKLAGRTKSSKQRKAEALISEGVDIRIVGESDFLRLTSESNSK